MKFVKFAAWLGIIFLCVAVVRLFPRDAAGKYTPTELQQAKLEAKQARAQLAQQRYADAAAVFTAAVAEFNAEVEAVKKENSWPDTVGLDENALSRTNAIVFVDKPKLPNPMANPGKFIPPKPPEPSPAPSIPSTNAPTPKVEPAKGEN